MSKYKYLEFDITAGNECLYRNLQTIQYHIADLNATLPNNGEINSSIHGEIDELIESLKSLKSSLRTGLFSGGRCVGVQG